MTPGPGIEPGTHWWKASALTTTPTLLPKGRQQSFWKFTILSYILDLKWCRPDKRKIHSQLSAMFTCRDGKGGELSNQASKMLYKLPGEVYIASYKERLDQSDCWKLFVQLWNYTKSYYFSAVGKFYWSVILAIFFFFFSRLAVLILILGFWFMSWASLTSLGKWREVYMK